MNLRPKSAQNAIENSPDVQVELIRADQITLEMETTWRRLCASNPDYSSPYFDVEFVRAVDRVRQDVEIAVLKKDRQEIVGFFPFQRISDCAAEPVGGRLNDMHGIIGPPSLCFQMLDVLKQSGLSSFSFHALAGSNSGSDDFEFNRPSTYFIDLSSGWDAYYQWAVQHSLTLKRQPQKTRALCRNLGDIRFEFDCVRDGALEQLISLKRAKYRRVNTFDILSVPWSANLLREIHAVSRDSFQGILSALWAGDEMVAGHFGMLRGNKLHYWFPAFDIRYSKYSPGSELILKVAQTAAERGIDVIDFGYGDDAYKLKFCDGRGQVGCGQFRFSRLGFQIAKQRFHFRNRLREIPMKSTAKTLLRGVYPGFGQWNFR